MDYGPSFRQSSSDHTRGTHHGYRVDERAVDERTYRRDSFEEPVRPSSYRGGAGGGGDRRDPYYSRRAEIYDSERPASHDYPPDRRGGDNRPRPVDSQRPKPSKVLGVFGLSTYTTERDLYDIFSSFGHVKEIKMIYDNLTGKSRGFAFVYYDSTEDATHAKARGDQGMEIDGRLVRVDYSLTQAPHPPTPGVYMGKSKRRPMHDGYDRRDRSYGDRRPMAPSRRVLSPDDGGVAYDYRRDTGPQGRHRSPGSPRRDFSRDMENGHDGSMRKRIRTLSSSRSRSPPPVYHPRQRAEREEEPKRRLVSRSPLRPRSPRKVIDGGSNAKVSTVTVLDHA